jgi:hypothetical protein
MSRSGYGDDYDQWAMIRWRGAVASAIRGRRGQALLREMLAALDAMEAKRLVADDLVRNGEVCALGALGVARGLSMADIDPEDLAGVAAAFGIVPTLVAEISYMNDEWPNHNVAPEERFRRMREWIAGEIKS